MFCLPFLAYILMVISYYYALSVSIFDRKNITYFLDLYDQVCSDYNFPKSNKIYQLFWYYEFFIRRYVKILIKSADKTATRFIL